jgi:hypothetical protein
MSGPRFVRDRRFGQRDFFGRELAIMLRGLMRLTDIALPRSPTHTTLTKPFYAHFAQFLSSLAFDKKTTALRRSFLVPTFVYRHRFIFFLVIRMPVSYTLVQSSNYSIWRCLLPLFGDRSKMRLAFVPPECKR